MSGLYGGMLKGSGNHIATCQHGRHCECSECGEIKEEDESEEEEQDGGDLKYGEKKKS